MDGPLDDIAFVVVALILAYGIYQTAGVGLDTDVPVVAVTSASMQPELYRGDMVVVRGEPFAEIEEGEIVVYTTGNVPVPVIHRVVEKNATALQTKGDNNPGQEPWEKHITPDQVLGTRIATVPMIGYVKLVPTCIYLRQVYGDRTPDTVCPPGQL